ncbi:hypothetical protein BGP_2804 [Beggiatoa sp. PS]|nr:hypothetical protein BGP_2804 [Beggiatoa sp. PS]
MDSIPVFWSQPIIFDLSQFKTKVKTFEVFKTLKVLGDFQK